MSDLLVGYGGDKPTAPSGSHEALVRQCPYCRSALTECGACPNWTCSGKGSAAKVESLTSELQEARADATNLRWLINQDLPCVDGCSTHGHVDGCPYANVIDQLAHHLKERDEARTECSKLRAALTELVEVGGCTEDYSPREEAAWEAARALLFAALYAEDRGGRYPDEAR